MSIETRHGGLQSAKVRAALYYARKRRLARLSVPGANVPQLATFPNVYIAPGAGGSVTQSNTGLTAIYDTDDGFGRISRWRNINGGSGLTTNGDFVKWKHASVGDFPASNFHLARVGLFDGASQAGAMIQWGPGYDAGYKHAVTGYTSKTGTFNTHFAGPTATGYGALWYRFYRAGTSSYLYQYSADGDSWTTILTGSTNKKSSSIELNYNTTSAPGNVVYLKLTHYEEFIQ